jgi:hypothetical protein
MVEGNTLPSEQVLSPHDGTTLDRSHDREKVVEIRELIALLTWLQTPELSLKTPSVCLAGVRCVAVALSYTSARVPQLLF